MVVEPRGCGGDFPPRTMSQLAFRIPPVRKPRHNTLLLLIQAYLSAIELLLSVYCGPLSEPKLSIS